MDLNVKGQYIADENEREEGAKYYLDRFGEGLSKSITITVGQFRDKNLLEKTASYINHKLNVSSLETKEVGFFTKKTVLNVKLQPQIISYKNMLSITNVQYDLILAFEVSVMIECIE